MAEDMKNEAGFIFSEPGLLLDLDVIVSHKPLLYL